MVDHPSSIGSIAPLILELLSDARKMMAFATSSARTSSNSGRFTFTESIIGSIVCTAAKSIAEESILLEIAEVTPENKSIRLASS